MHSKTKDNFITFRGRENQTATIAADTYSIQAVQPRDETELLVLWISRAKSGMSALVVHVY
jgi:hypothetical protein